MCGYWLRWVVWLGKCDVRVYRHALVEWVWGGKIGGGKWFENLTFLLILRLIVKPESKFVKFLAKSTNRNIFKVKESCIIISAHDAENSLLRSSR